MEEGVESMKPDSQPPRAKRTHGENDAAGACLKKDGQGWYMYIPIDELCPFAK
jgi:hypothetical protein